MAVARWIPVLVVMFSFPPGFFECLDPEDILDLRTTRNNGTNGRFVVPRPLLEDELERLGLTGRVQLLSSAKYNSDFEGEVPVFMETAVDMTLHQELPPELEQHVSSSGTFLTFALPVVASDGSHSVILLAYFSDAPSPVLSAYLTSVEAVHHIDSIEVGNGFVTLRHGSDVMHIEVDNNEGCHDDEDVGIDFDHVTGKDIRLSSFPSRFNWGCDILGNTISFCRKLEPFMEKINKFNGDVCTELSTSMSERCPASMRITKMTGVFREAVPFLADMVPIESFESEWIAREHGVGIVFPCFKI